MSPDDDRPTDPTDEDWSAEVIAPSKDACDRPEDDGIDSREGVAFHGVETHEELIECSRRYCERAVARHGLAVELSMVEWDVSTRAKRRAAAVKRPRIPEATVGEPMDWDALVSERGAELAPADVDPETHLRTCEVVLTWAAFETFSPGEWADTLRHELVHVEQFQRFGTTNHGQAFRRRAEAVDASVSCRSFATPKYRVTCDDCGGLVARRYRECPLVREPETYHSSCCEGELLVHPVGPAD